MSTSSALVEVTGLAKSFGDNQVIKDVSFDVRPGTVTCIIGPSGSGKTTLLRTLNALEIADRGVVRVGERSVDYADVRPGRRGRLSRAEKETLAQLRAQSGMVFQSHDLFPHKTAIENVTEGPIVVQGESAAEATARAAELLARVGLPTTRTSTPTSSPAARPSASASRGRWRCGPSWCSSTSRRRPSTPSSSARCSA